VNALEAENLQLRNLLAALLPRIEQVEENQEDIAFVRALRQQWHAATNKHKALYEEGKTMFHNLSGTVKKKMQEGQKQLDVLGQVLQKQYEGHEDCVRASLAEATEQGKQNWKACEKDLDKKFDAVHAAFSKLVFRVEALEKSLPTSALVCIAVCFSLVSYCLVFYCLVFSCFIMLLIDD
jgi:hypothetical protein